MVFLKLAIRPFVLHPYFQLFTAVVIGGLIFSGGLLMWGFQIVNQFSYQVRQEQVVTAYLNPQMEVSQVTELKDKIQKIISDIPAEKIEKVEWVDVNGFLDEMKDYDSELKEQLMTLGHEVEAVVPQYVSISGQLPENFSQIIEQVSGIQKAESSLHRFRTLLSAFLSLRFILVVFLLALLGALLFVVFFYARKNANTYSDIVPLLKLMGAHHWALFFPPFLSGVFVALTGGGISCLLWILGAPMIEKQIRILFPVFFESTITAPSFIILFISLSGAIGVFSGIISQWRTHQSHA